MTTNDDLDLHPACAAWPEMSPKDLSELAEDIAANGLRDAITLTPDGKLLDGRNRWKACLMAGVEIPDDKIEVYAGDPFLFSLSKNKHRRHMTTDQIAMVAAAMVTTTRGMNRFTDTSNEVSIAKAAETLEVPRTAVESAKVVLEHGAEEEKAAVRSGMAKVRSTADKIRAQMRPADARPTPAENIEGLKRDIAAKDAEIKRLKAEIEKRKRFGNIKIYLDDPEATAREIVRKMSKESVLVLLELMDGLIADFETAERRG